ncbi:acyltransferase [Pseudomonas asuensis]|uniref:Acyltransferase n=1 Tax=Pseudomonas asuensis TaxID=1825787 RepID=A0ABQ2GYM4_9PSED|nr:acyltransferase [Pseudomonas asuensis]GGM17897.1 acyltransferase [Pseudomonas asuensis]
MTATLELLIIYVLSMVFLDRLFRRLNILSEQALTRSSPIDALRGLLSTTVVCCHFMVTYQWKTTGEWAGSDSSALLNNMGAVPVTLFFMITGFLFFGKIYQRKPDWPQIFQSRFWRIMPLYAFVVAVVVFISLYRTEFDLVSPLQLVKESLRWAVFLGASFNGFQESRLITAGVQWTLKYEWFFYLALPVLAALINRESYGRYLVLSLIAVVAALPAAQLEVLKLHFLLFFLAGFIPVLIKRHRPVWIDYMKKPIFGALAIALITYSMTMPDYFSLPQILLLSVAFAIIALGNDLFGMLSSYGLKALGEISYSVYLIHGLVLYSLFSWLNVYPFTGSNINHYIMLLPLVLLVVCGISLITFLGIERPFMLKPKKGLNTIPPL